MASRVKVIRSDIKQKHLKEFLTNLTKHALALMLGMPEYTKIANTEKESVNDLMKNSKFKKEFIWLLGN